LERSRLSRWLDRAALAGLAAGLALYLVDVRAGFFVTFAFIVLHTFTSRR
jgi:hypothetical protein